MGNRPVEGVDPDGRLAWFVPVIAGAVIGSVTGGITAHKNGSNWWKGAIVGGLIGAAAGAGVSAAIGPAGGITGMTVGNSTAASAALTKSWGIATSAIMGANTSMASTAIRGGNLDNIYKSGLVGAASGAFSASGGFGLVNAWGSKSNVLNFAGRQLYQAIGSAGQSIGNNWAMGEDLLSRVSVGVGPVNLTFGKGQSLFQINGNIGNIATNAFGLANLAFGGSMSFNWKHLTPNYSGGFIDKFFAAAWGPYSVLYPSDQLRTEGDALLAHELHHTWQSRALGDSFLRHYAGQGVLGLLLGRRSFSIYNAVLHGNYYENVPYNLRWFKKSR
jgi:hypothetical protein